MYNGAMGEQGFFLAFFVIGGLVVGRAAALGWKKLLSISLWALIFVGIPFALQWTTERRALFVSVPLFLAAALLAYLGSGHSVAMPPAPVGWFLLGGLLLMGGAVVFYLRFTSLWALLAAGGMAGGGGALIGLSFYRLALWLHAGGEREEGSPDV